MLNWQMRLGVARLIARQKAPYWRAALLGMVPKVVEGLGTMAVTEDFVLFIDPIVFDLWDDEQVAFALVHELYHPLMEHFRRGAGYTKQKANIAGDLADNQVVRKMGFKPVPGALFPEMYRLPPDLSMEAYLRLLPDDVPDPDNDPRTGGQPQEGDGKGGGKDGSGTGGDQKQKRPMPGTCRGKCGSGAGNPVPGEPTSDGVPDRRTKAEASSIRRQVAEAVKAEASAHRGTIGADLERWANETLKPPKIPWQSKLAGVARMSVAVRPGATVHTYRKISRRQAGIGFGPGRPVIPAFHSPRPLVANITDTSGSMGTDELVIAMSEGKAIFDALRARVICCTCDAKTQGIKKVRDWKEVIPLMKGGGGTDMRPAFEEVMKMRPHPEIIVCFTDGCVGDGIPKEQPPGVRVIFVLVGPHKRSPCAWGEQIFVE